MNGRTLMNEGDKVISFGYRSQGAAGSWVFGWGDDTTLADTSYAVPLKVESLYGVQDIDSDGHIVYRPEKYVQKIYVQKNLS